MLLELPPASSRFVLPVYSQTFGSRTGPVVGDRIDRQVTVSVHSQSPVVTRRFGVDEDIAPPPGDGLSPLEMQVVQIARRDHWITVPSRRRLVRLIQRLRADTSALADARLEGLRAHLVVYRSGRPTSDFALAGVVEGFSAAQLRLAEAMTDLALPSAVSPS